MIARQTKILQLQLHLFSITLLILSALLHAQPLYAAPLPDSINWLWQTPPDQAQVDLRLTSVDGTGKRRIAEVTLNYSRNDETSKLAAEVKTKDQADRNFCFQCTALGILTPCDKEDGLMPKSAEALIPGTRLSWRVLITGFCYQFKALRNQQHSDAHHDVFDVLPLEQNNQATEFKLRVFVSKATKLPEKIAYINTMDREVSIIDIHEIRNTIWGRVVTRSTYRDLHTQARVLIEVRSGSASAPPEMERR
jgi:cytidylate kinase